MTRNCSTCGSELPRDGHGRRHCGEGCWPSRQYVRLPVAARDDTDGPMDREELLGHLRKAARRGSVAAMTVLLRKNLTDAPKDGPLSVIDELVARRHQGGGDARALRVPLQRLSERSGSEA